jgi:hypothetical protein
MSTWNHRFCVEAVPDGLGGIEDYWSIREVYYNDKGEPDGYSTTAYAPSGATFIECADDACRMTSALGMPTFRIGADETLTEMPRGDGPGASEDVNLLRSERDAALAENEHLRRDYEAMRDSRSGAVAYGGPIKPGATKGFRFGSGGGGAGGSYDLQRAFSERDAALSEVAKTRAENESLTLQLGIALTEVRALEDERDAALSEVAQLRAENEDLRHALDDAATPTGEQ